VHIGHDAITADLVTESVGYGYGSVDRG